MMHRITGSKPFGIGTAVVVGGLLVISPGVAAITNPAPPVVTHDAVKPVIDVLPATPFNPEAPPQPEQGQVVKVNLEAARRALPGGRWTFSPGSWSWALQRWRGSISGAGHRLPADPGTVW